MEPGVTDYLRSLGVPFEHRIKIIPNGTIAQNAQALEGEIRVNAQSFGVQKVHLVAHSKGGLDSRGYLDHNYHPDEVRVLSLHTLTTPHQGSVLADISFQARTLVPRPVGQQGDGEMQAFIDNDFWIEKLGGPLGFGPQRPGLDDLQTESMQNFNSTNPFPGSVKFYTYGADADLDHDGNITGASQFCKNISTIKPKPGCC